MDDLQPQCEELLDQASVGDISARNYCDSCCFLKNIHLSEEAITTVQKCEGPNACRFHCTMNSDCRHWSLDQESGVCSLYASPYGRNSTASSGSWTGPNSDCGDF